MKKLLFLAVSSLLLSFHAKAQCAFSTSVVASGSTNICGTGSLVLSTSPTSDNWSQRANFTGGAIFTPVAFNIGNKGYTGVGTGTGSNNNTFWEYDPLTDSWTQKATFPMSVGSYSWASAFTVGSKAYVVAMNTSSVQLMYEYDPSTNVWTSKAAPGGGNRYLGIGFGIGTKGYFGTGFDLINHVPKNDFWEYTPSTNTWTQVANYGGGGRSSCVTFTLGTKGYVGLGQDAFSSQNDFWEYDPSSNTWTQKASYPGMSGSFGNGAASVGSKGYVIDYNSFLPPNFYEYSASTNSWTPRAVYTGTMGNFSNMFSAAGRIYVFNCAMPNVWQYDPTYTFLWSTGATSTSIAAASTGTYQVTMTSAIGCTASASQTVAISAYPVLSISGAGNSICSGSTAILTASGATTYSWSTGATTSTLSISPTVSTQYTLTGKNTFGCASSMVKPIVPVAPPAGTLLLASGNICVSSASLAVTPTGNQWTQKANFGGTLRNNAIGFSIGNKGYLGLNGFPNNDLWEYDPSANTWTQKANFPSILNDYAAFSIGGKGYAAATTFTGEVFYEYDPTANTWTQKTSPPTGSRSGALAFSSDSKGYFGCGQNGLTFYDDLWEYDPFFDTWTQKANVGGGGRKGGIGFSVGTKCYAGLGTNSTFSSLSDFWEYNPGTNTWTQKANFTGQSYGENIPYNLGSKGYILQTNYNFSPNLYEYTPSTDSWTTVSTFTGGSQYDAAGFSIGNKLYFGAGGTNAFWEYEPAHSVLWSTSATSPSITVSSSATYSVVLTNSQGCASSLSKVITFYSPPTVTASSTSATACFGGTTSLLGGGASTYIWSNGVADGAPFTVTNSAVYTVTGTAASGCTNTASQFISVASNPTVTAGATNTVICLGKSVTLNGGGAGSYSWTDGRINGIAFSPTITNTYTVTGTSFPACTGTAAISITVNPVPSLTATASSSVICNGSTVTLNASGASTYTWTSSVVNGAAFTPTNTGSYTVTGADATTGCTNTAVRSITVNPLPTVTASATQTVICLNTTVSLSGGGASTYTWTGGVSNGAAFSPTVTTTYTVTGSSAANCINTAVKTITVNNLPNVTASATSSAICNGASTSLSGGGASSYSWSHGVINGSSFSPTSTVTYTVTGTDANTCTNTAVISVTVNSLPSVAANASTPSLCVGGTVSLSGSGATSYAWTGGITNGAAFSPTSTQSYTVTGTNAATSCTNTAVRTITVYNLPTVTAAASNPVICMNGTTSLNGGGASSYAWTGGVSNGVVFSPTLTASYTVTGTDVNTCTNTAVASITVNSLPTVTASATKSVICNGELVTLSGGGANTYSWTGGVTNGAAFTPSTTLSYTVTGTDMNNCKNTAVRSITVNPLPVVTASASAPVLCNNGATTALSGGGATTYTWTGGILDGVPFVPSSTSSYTVTGTLAATGCTNTASKTITVNNLPVVTANASSPTICVGAPLTLSGGGATTYTWTGGAIDAAPFNPTATAQYTVVGTDLNSCTNTAVTSVTVFNLPLVSAGISSSVICNGDQVVLTGSGANNYNWTGGATDGLPFSPGATGNFTVTGTDLNNCSNIAVISVTVNALPPVTANASRTVICAGDYVTLTGGGASTYTWTSGVVNSASFAPIATDSYTVTGTDLNGCLNSASINVTVNALPNVTVNVSAPVICMGQTTSLSGGGAVTYTWTNGVVNGAPFSPTTSLTYTVTGTDGNGCINSNSQLIVVNTLPLVTAAASSPSVCTNSPLILTGGGASFYTWTGGAVDGLPFSPASSTVYTVTGTDVNNCSSTATIAITVHTSPVVTASTSNSVICNGDPTTLNGGGALTYTWSGNALDGVPFNPSSTDTYTVVGTAANTCTNNAVISVTVYALPNVTASTSHSVICLNYTTSLIAAGATTYTWSNGVTNAAAFAPTASDTYTVTGTDNNGCRNTAIQSITVNALPAVTASVSSAVICSGESTTLTGSGAVTYTWTGGAINGAAFSPSSTSTYTVTGTDANTCSNTATISVTVNTTPTIVIQVTNSVICLNDQTSLSGSGAFSYTWTGGISDGVAFSPTVTDTYTVTGTSVSGCTNTAATTVTVNNLPQVIGTASTPSLCVGGITSLNGSGAVTYNWSNGVVNGVAFSPIATTIYTVTGIDQNNCSNTNTVLVTVSAVPSITATSSQSVICDGDQVTLTGSGASTYTWTSNVLDGVPFTPSVTTTYSAIGMSAGCTSGNYAILTITVNAQPMISLNSGSICSGDSFTLDPSGAVSYTFSSGPVVSPAVTSTYSVTGSSTEGCLNLIPVTSTVVVNALPVISILPSATAVCVGNSATLSASGAINYTWNTGSTASVIVVTPSSAVSVTLTGIDQNACRNATILQLVTAQFPDVSIASNLVSICKGESIHLSAGGASSYAWNTGDTTSTLSQTPSITTTYSVTGSNGSFCNTTKTISILVTAVPDVDAGEDIYLQAGQTEQLNASQFGGNQYSWSSGEGLSSTSILDPIVTIDHDITYTLTVTSPRGCSASDEVSVFITDGITISNYMSPNADGKNDTWKISNLHLIKSYSIEVIDGWGKTVYSKPDSYDNDFDARDLPDGVYYYFIKDNGKLKYKGSITVTR